jgi:hypothetical protein
MFLFSDTQRQLHNGSRGQVVRSTLPDDPSALTNHTKEFMPKNDRWCGAPRDQGGGGGRRGRMLNSPGVYDSYVA